MKTLETIGYVTMCVITLLPALYALYYFVTWLLGWREPPTLNRP